MTQYFGYLVEYEKYKSKAVVWMSTKVKGSMPRKSSYKMIVLPNGEVVGKLMGSAVEKMMIEQSKQMLSQNRPNTYRIRPKNINFK